VATIECTKWRDCENESGFSGQLSEINIKGGDADNNGLFFTTRRQRLSDRPEIHLTREKKTSRGRAAEESCASHYRGKESEEDLRKVESWKAKPIDYEEEYNNKKKRHSGHAIGEEKES